MATLSPEDEIETLKPDNSPAILPSISLPIFNHVPEKFL